MISGRSRQALALRLDGGTLDLWTRLEDLEDREALEPTWTRQATDPDLWT
jgi:hypothetical protein